MQLDAEWTNTCPPVFLLNVTFFLQTIRISTQIFMKCWAQYFYRFEIYSAQFLVSNEPTAECYLLIINRLWILWTKNNMKVNKSIGSTFFWHFSSKFEQKYGPFREKMEDAYSLIWPQVLPYVRNSPSTLHNIIWSYIVDNYRPRLALNKCSILTYPLTYKL